jgi:hypothetical protein
MYLKSGVSVCKLALLAFNALISVANANAQTRSASLERQFWYCDYVGTTRGVGAAPVAPCSAVTEQVLHSRFGGDYVKFLAWWKQNKSFEHNRLAERGF